MSATPFSVVRLGKHLFATGLTWVPVTRPRDLKADAKVQMGKYGGDAYVIRQVAGSAQVGIASTKDGCASGMLTLAGAIADHVASTDQVINGQRQRLNDWIGIFELPNDRWFVLAVRDGSIVPNCDFAGEIEDAYDLLEQTYGIGGWTAVLGSPNLPMRSNYHNYLPVTIDEALGLKNGSVPKARRYAINAKRDLKTVIAAGGIGVTALVAIAAGWWVFQEWQAKKDAEELAAMQAEMAAMQAAQQRLAAPGRRVIETPRTWNFQPTPASLVRSCESHLDIPAAPGSWSLTGFACETGGSVVALARDNSNIAFLRELLPEAAVSGDQNSAEWRRPFTTLEVVEEDLPPWAEIETSFISKMQTLNVAFSIAAPIVPPPPAVDVEEAKDVDIIPADWMERRVTVGPTPTMPKPILDLINAPGLRLTKISYTGGQWTYEGTFYAK